jgi:CheY-like chemotaxis protein
MESRNESILVVEDDANSVTLLVDLLTAHGYRVVSEVTGLTATKRLAEETVDLVLLDLRLPEQNGFMVAETLKRNPVRRSRILFPPLPVSHVSTPTWATGPLQGETSCCKLWGVYETGSPTTRRQATTCSVPHSAGLPW